MPRFYSQVEAARVWGVSEKSVRNWTSRGQVRVVYRPSGRKMIEAAEVERWQRQHGGEEGDMPV